MLLDRDETYKKAAKAHIGIELRAVALSSHGAKSNIPLVTMGEVISV